MGDEPAEGEPPKYMLDIPDPSGKPKRLLKSRDYTGPGKATYKLEEDQQEIYDGDFVNGNREGRGTYKFKNGDVYTGNYHDNKRSGLGTMNYKVVMEEGNDDPNALPKRGGKFYGTYKDGKRSTDGTFTYVNGDVYRGQWLNGKKHGTGTYSFAKDGTTLDGNWVKGKFTHGKWILPHGVYYTGPFRYNKPNGNGIWMFSNGNQLIGDYTQTLEAVEVEGGGEPPEEGKEKPPPPDPKVTGVAWRSLQATAIQG